MRAFPTIQKQKSRFIVPILPTYKTSNHPTSYEGNILMLSILHKPPSVAKVFDGDGDDVREEENKPSILGR